MKAQLPELRLDGDWSARHRAWAALAEECLYGRAPEPGEVVGEIVQSRACWEGQAVQEIIRVHCGPERRFAFTAELYRPAVPGRRAVITWNRPAKGSDECPREEAVVSRGYILAQFNREQLAGDWLGGMHRLRRGYPSYDWGAIRAWAWAHSRMADYLITRDDVDAARLACTGFSRGGKAALAAGVFDPRFGICVPVCSGAGGAGCVRWLGDGEGFHQDPRKAESLARVVAVFPHWWKRGLRLTRAEARLGEGCAYALDGHLLRALIAPRSLLTLDGMVDAWANPRGTALAWRAAQPVFDRLGGRNVAAMRRGGHGFTREDWLALLDFCDEVFYNKPTGRDWHASAPPAEWSAID